jgi:hypothetical protein
MTSTDRGASKCLTQHRQLKCQLAQKQFLKGCFTDPNWPTAPAPTPAPETAPPQLSRAERVAAARKPRSLEKGDGERKMWANTMESVLTGF